MPALSRGGAAATSAVLLFCYATHITHTPQQPSVHKDAEQKQTSFILLEHTGTYKTTFEFLDANLSPGTTAFFFLVSDTFVFSMFFRILFGSQKLKQ